jgi:hypothetical protein
VDDEQAMVALTILADIRAEVQTIRKWLREEDDGEEAEAG